MSANLKRYDFYENGWGEAEMIEAPAGDFVCFSDHEAAVASLRAQLEAVTAERDALRMVTGTWAKNAYIDEHHPKLSRQILAAVTAAHRPECGCCLCRRVPATEAGA